MLLSLRWEYIVLVADGHNCSHIIVVGGASNKQIGVGI